MLEEFYLAFTGAGKVEVDERIDKDGDSYCTVELLETKTEDVRLTMGWDGLEEEATDKVHFRMSQHHALNSDTGRVFHAHLSISLGSDELRRLRNMINFLLEK